jgi:DNA-binding MarR family transcriptional regulator
MSTTQSLMLASDLRTVISRMAKKLRGKSETGAKLSLTERSTLSLLDQHGKLLPSELAAMEKITTQSMSQVLRYLASLGYIARRKSPTDGRKVIISLSQAGQHIVHQARNERDEWLNRAMQETCSAGERQHLRRSIGLLTRLVDAD